MSSGTRRTQTAVVLTAIALLVSPSLGQTRHRARLSQDLEDAITRDARGVAVIVHGDRATVQRLAERHGARVKKLMQSGAVLEVDRSGLESLGQDPEVDHLSGDLPVRRSLDVTAETIGATTVWAGVDGLPALSGRGIGVAIIDSGIAPHAALDGRVARSVDFWNEGGRGNDQFGHGTHVAGIVGGDSTSVEGQRYRGIAPGVHLINLRVLGPDGSGKTSDAIEAIDWAVANRSRYNIRIINLSLGRPVTESYEDDPLCEAVERAVAAGVIVIASAGNNGKLADGTAAWGGIASPGNSPYALTVGALNTRQTTWRSDDVVTSYSSRGPTAIDRVVKPDLVAPGNRIVSLEARGSMLARDWPDAHVAGKGRDAYFLMSGSSMATAVVSGAVALLLEANGSLRPFDVKLALQMAATPVPGASVLDAGAGALNVLSAVRLARAALDGRVSVDELPSATFANEPVVHAGFGFFNTGLRHLVWSDATRIVWGDATRIVWGDATRIVWGDVTRIVWGDSTRIVWGDTDRIVWGDWTRIVWGDWTRIVWGDLSVWGDEVR